MGGDARFAALQAAATLCRVTEQVVAAGALVMLRAGVGGKGGRDEGEMGEEEG